MVFNNTFIDFGENAQKTVLSEIDYSIFICFNDFAENFQKAIWFEINYFIFICLIKVFIANVNGFAESSTDILVILVGMFSKPTALLRSVFRINFSYHP